MSAPETAGPDLARTDSFAFWTREKIRFQDVDRFGHVNNVAFAVYAESGRLEFLGQLAGVAPLPEGCQWVIARLLIDFRAQAFYPGEVAIGTRLIRLGRSSVALGQGLFAGDGCFATAEAVVVLIDQSSGSAMALPEALRRALEGVSTGGAPSRP